MHEFAPPNPVAAAQQLHIWLGQIMRDETRFQSFEYTVCLERKARICAYLRKLKINPDEVFKAYDEVSKESVDCRVVAREETTPILAGLDVDQKQDVLQITDINPAIKEPFIYLQQARAAA